MLIQPASAVNSAGGIPDYSEMCPFGGIFSPYEHGNTVAVRTPDNMSDRYGPTQSTACASHGQLIYPLKRLA